MLKSLPDMSIAREQIHVLKSSVAAELTLHLGLRLIALRYKGSWNSSYVSYLNSWTTCRLRAPTRHLLLRRKCPCNFSRPSPCELQILRCNRPWRVQCCSGHLLLSVTVSNKAGLLPAPRRASLITPNAHIVHGTLSIFQAIACLKGKLNISPQICYVMW